MNTSSIESDFKSARVKTAVTIMNATGWKQGVVNPDRVSVDSVFFYVFDHQSGWIWCCSIPKDAFYAALERSKAELQEDLIGFCNQMIAECAAGNGLNPDKENSLAMALSAYIGITRSYQLTERATKQNHFAVIRYGQTDTIRPFAMRGPARHLLPADVIDASMQKVTAIDLENHPDWIAKP